MAMFKAIFYKEWIKTRMSVLVMAAVMAAAVIYSFINTAQEFRVVGAVAVWNNIITKDTHLLPGLIQWVPVLMGLMLALAQFVPEMTDKRLKLTLHLPAPESRIMSLLLTYGATVLVSVFILSYAALVAGMSRWYPAEMISGMCLRSLPWFIGGWCAYLLTAWICLEPIWKHKVFDALAGVCLCSFFFFRGMTGSYLPFLPYLIVFAIACFAFPFYSAARFKEGAQK